MLTRLAARPTAAKTSISPPSIFAGWVNRCQASTKIHAAIANRSIPLTTAAKISSRVVTVGPLRGRALSGEGDREHRQPQAGHISEHVPGISQQRQTAGD